MKDDSSLKAVSIVMHLSILFIVFLLISSTMSMSGRLKLIRDHGSIEKILDVIQTEKNSKGELKYTIPSDWLPPKAKSTGDEDDTDNEDLENKQNGEEETTDEFVPTYVQARYLFHNHEVDTDVELKWKEPDSKELIKFLVEEHGFNADRVKASIEKLEKAHKANLKPQARMEQYFSFKPNPVADAKRKQRLEEEKAKKKQKKGGYKKR
jgi:flap endonuclease-1